MPRAFLITNKRYNGRWILTNSKEDAENCFILNQGSSGLHFDSSSSLLNTLSAIEKTTISSMNYYSNGQSSPMDNSGLNCKRISLLTHAALSRHFGNISIGENNHLIEQLHPHHPSFSPDFSVHPLNLIINKKFNESKNNNIEINGFYLGTKAIADHSFDSTQEEAEDLTIHSRNLTSPNESNQSMDYSDEPYISDQSQCSPNPIVDENIFNQIEENHDVPFTESREIYPSSGNSESPAIGDNHVCIDCGKRYSTSSNLARHRQTHRSFTDKKARQCPHCSKVYVSMPAYSMHLRTHKQNCRCPHCGKCFSRPWLLQGHIRTHTGERPFKCPTCSKAFADKSNLRAHIQTHSNIKPYVCQRCGKAFTLKSYLYKHEDSSCMRLNRSSNGPITYVSATTTINSGGKSFTTNNNS